MTLALCESIIRRKRLAQGVRAHPSYSHTAPELTPGVSYCFILDTRQDFNCDILHEAQWGKFLFPVLSGGDQRVVFLTGCFVSRLTGAIRWWKCRIIGWLGAGYPGKEGCSSLTNPMARDFDWEKCNNMKDIAPRRSFNATSARCKRLHIAVLAKLIFVFDYSARTGRRVGSSTMLVK